MINLEQDVNPETVKHAVGAGLVGLSFILMGLSGKDRADRKMKNAVTHSSKDYFAQRAWKRAPLMTGSIACFVIGTNMLTS